jgi:hypothetical protein
MVYGALPETFVFAEICGTYINTMEVSSVRNILPPLTARPAIWRFGSKILQNGTRRP